MLRQTRSTDGVGEDVAVGRQDVLGSDEGQERREDLPQLLHVKVSPLHPPLVDAVGCAAQQVGLWVSKHTNQSLTNDDG